MAYIRDMTSGNPTKLLLSFALPMLLGNLFQQMYSMVDTIVVGRVVGVEALASMGAASWMDWLVLGIAMGFTQGFSIYMAQRFGAEDYVGLRKSVCMSALLSILMAAVMTAVSLLCLRPLLRLMDTPEDIIGGSIGYLRIIFSCLTVIIGYNFFASVLRALGDSKTPLMAMVVASLLNIGLDLLFVAVFHWGIAGAAFATVLAQLCSCLYCLYALVRLPILKVALSDWKPERRLLGKLIGLGVPIAFQNAIISIGGIVVQTLVNGYGFVFVAGVTAAHKLCGLMEQAGTSFGSAVGTFASQNLGAGQYGRIRQGVRSSLKISISVSLVIAAAVILFGRRLVLLFITGEPEIVTQVADIAYNYLVVMSAMLFVLYMLFIYRSTLQGMGDTITPMISGFVELGMRIGMVLLLPYFLGKTGFYIAEVSAWFGAAVLLLSVYYYKIGRLQKTADSLAQPEQPVVK